MVIPSHRLRVEEKKLYHRLVYTILFIILAVVIVIYAGLPIAAKIILGATSLRKENPAKTDVTASLLFPPVLESTFEATNSARITIAGFADKDTTVKIFVSGKEKAKVLVDKDGKFKAAGIFLVEGTNTITAQTVKETQESGLSSPISIIYKKSPAKLDIDAPPDGQKFSGSNQNITISGKTDPESRITINDRLAIVDPDGKFSFLVKLTEGENNFKIVATDTAGNQVNVEKKVTYSP